MTAIAMDAAIDRARWEAAYRSAFPRVYRGLIEMGAHADEAEDALHDAFVKGLARPAGAIESVDGWIFVVASRAWRRRRIRDRLFLPWTILLDQETPAPDERSTDVIAALRALPLRQRQVLVARFVVGLTQEETAAAFGIARGTVAATTSQASAALRKRMEAK